MNPHEIVAGRFPIVRSTPPPMAPAAEPKPEPDRLMTPKECAEYCKVHRGRIDAALEMRQLRFVNMGPRTRRIWLSDLKKWLASKTVKASTRANWLD
jgi:excisionase family DNA binding protein